jgi:hypothetical protein
MQDSGLRVRVRKASTLISKSDATNAPDVIVFITIFRGFAPSC